MLVDGDLDRWAGEAVAATGVPGLSVAVAHPGGLAVGVAGVRNLETGDPVTADSVFQVGSTMKVATAVAVMQSVEAGLISLDDPVVEHLPFLRVGESDVEAVSVRRLLDHTCGLPGNYFADFGRGDETIDLYVRSLADQEMVHRPGSMFSYSNAGYVVAGRLLEAVHRTPFRDLISERVFGPLGLTSTTTRIEDVYGHRVAAGHELAADGSHRLCPQQVVGWSSVPAGSQAMSTAAELATFARRMADPSGDAEHVLARSSAEEMTRVSVELPCPYWGRSSQGLGWGVDHRDGRICLSHGGGTTGHSALMLSVPDISVSIAALTNTAGGALLNAHLDDLVFDLTGMAPARSTPEIEPVRATAADHEAWVGIYTDAWMRHVVEADEADELVLRRTVLPNPLVPEGELPRSPLFRLDDRTVVAGTGRPIVFLSEDGADRPTHFHQVSAARRTG